MESFQRYLAQGEQLAFTGEKLAGYVQQCEERDSRAEERQREKKKKKKEK